MGIKIKKPKIKAPKAVSKAISSTTKAVGSAVKGAGGAVSQIAQSAAKGDIKGIASGVSGAVQTAKDLTKDLGKSQLEFSTGGLERVGGLFGNRDISQFARNVNKEGTKGIDTYGDVAMDVGANVATGGTYGAAKSALGALQSGGLKGLLDPKQLQKQALQAGAAYAGIDPNMLKAAQGAVSGDLKAAALQSLGSYAGVDPSMLKMAEGALKGNIGDAALQAGLSAAGSYAGIDPNQLKMAQAGLSAFTGDKAGLASGLASQFGAGQDISKLVGSLASGGDLKGAALQGLGSYAELPQEQIQMAQMGLSAIKGDETGLASGLASQFGAGEEASNLIGKAAGGNMDFKKMALEQLGSFGALPENIAQGLGQLGGDTLSRAAQTYGREVISDQAGAYTPEITAQYEKQLEDFKNKTAEKQKQFSQEIQQAVPRSVDVKIKPGDTIAAIAKRHGVTPQELMAANPNIKNPNQIAAGANITIPKRKPTEPQPQAKEQSFWDQTKDFLGGVGSKISSAAGAIGDFAAENKTALGIGAQGAAALAGYQAGKKGLESSTELTNQQLADLQRAGQSFEKQAYDPTRYAQERQFLGGRIAGGGVTAQEKQMQQQGDIRAARAAAAARLSGQEQMARMGGRGKTGASLAASLAGGQSVMGEQSATNLAREASASERLQKDIERQTMLSRQQTAEEAELAKSQGEFALQRSQQTGAVRTNLAELEQAKAAALQNLYGRGADLATAGLQSLKSENEKKAEAQKQEYENQMREAELKKKQAETTYLGQFNKTNQKPQQQTQPQQTYTPAPKPTPNQGQQSNVPAGGMSMPPQQPQGIQGILGGVAQKGQELMSQIPEKQKQQLQTAAGSFVNKYLPKL